METNQQGVYIADSGLACHLLGITTAAELARSPFHGALFEGFIAAEIVKAAARFKSDITIVRDELEVNGKSIMGVMMLAAEQGASLQLRAEGPDAEQALDALATLIANKFGEG